ncbi:MAG: hypothetical protein WKG07_43070 [Hymenobacter sp.]
MPAGGGVNVGQEILLRPATGSPTPRNDRTARGRRASCHPARAGHI